MQLVRILALSLFAGCIGAGTVWYGWGLAENAMSVFKARRALAAMPAQEADADVETSETEEAAS